MALAGKSHVYVGNTSSIGHFSKPAMLDLWFYRVPWYQQLTWHQNPFKKIILATNMGGAKLVFKEDKLDHSFTKNNSQLCLFTLKLLPQTSWIQRFTPPRKTIGQLPNGNFIFQPPVCRVSSKIVVRMYHASSGFKDSRPFWVHSWVDDFPSFPVNGGIWTHSRLRVSMFNFGEV